MSGFSSVDPAVIGLGVLLFITFLILRIIRPAPRRRALRAERSPAKRPSPYHTVPDQTVPDDAPLLVVDGSNVMHWNGNTPKLATVREVVTALSARGYRVGVMFDANAGYKLFDHYAHDSRFAIELGLPENQIMVVPKGTQADGHLLNAARDLGARIVTNDRFRDYAERYPEVARPGHLIKGGYRKGKLWLAFDPK